MFQAMTTQLEELAKFRHEATSELIAEAVKIGVSQLYVESVLSQYVHKHLSRAKAIQRVGLQTVKLAELQHKAAQTDIAWGLLGKR